MKNIIKRGLRGAGRIRREETKDMKNIFGRMKRRDFSGTGGQVMKNSAYNVVILGVSKIASIIFTAIIARMLLPELFGLYSLTLFTILLFLIFSDLGISSAIITFISKFIAKKQEKKAKEYFLRLKKYKILLVTTVVIILILSARTIAENYYHKPIFLALLAGVLYIIFASIQSFFSALYIAENKFKHVMIQEMLFQITRLTLVPLAIIITLSSARSTEGVIVAIIVALALSYIPSSLYLKLKSKKELPFKKQKTNEITDKDKKRINKFLLPLSFTVFSGVFFAYIDTIMLGHYVSGAFIGFYSAAFGVIGVITALVGFLPGAVMPVFSGLKKKGLEIAFKKTVNLVFLTSLMMGILTFLLSKPLILLFYGTNYLPARTILSLFSILVVIMPLTALYDTYFTINEKTKTVAKLLVLVTMINIVLNWVLITQGLKTGMMQAIIGASIATIISRSIYLISIIIIKRKNKPYFSKT